MQNCTTLRMNVQACFVDIDATITDDGDMRQIEPGHPLSNALFSVLRDVMVQDGWDRDKAETALEAHANDVVFWDYHDFIGEFQLPARHAWDEIIRWHDDHLVVYPDAVRMVKRLHERGMPLYIISNNPILGCLLKLQRAGLGTLEGSPWFKDILGSNRLNGQKGSIDFWERAMAYTGLPVDDIAVIGDSVNDDLRIPQQIGVRHFCIVDRKRTDPITHQDGALFVNSLDLVDGLVGP
jgi:FMN phosphatase YigB (HAD superfamily)